MGSIFKAFYVGYKLYHNLFPFHDSNYI